MYIVFDSEKEFGEMSILTITTRCNIYMCIVFYKKVGPHIAFHQPRESVKQEINEETRMQMNA